MGQGIVRITTSPPGPVQVIQKQAEVSARTGKIRVRDMQTGKFTTKN